MTRGQESLIMSLETKSERYTATDVPLSTAIKVLRPSLAEASLHRKTLEVIQKESQGNCIWLALT